MTRGRRAQQFHELVEDSSTGGARLPEYADLLDVVGALRAVPAPVADPAFVAALRERLLAEAESVLVAAAAERDDTDARLRLRPTTTRDQAPASSARGRGQRGRPGRRLGDRGRRRPERPAGRRALPGQARPGECSRRAHLRPRRPRSGPARQRRHPPRRGAGAQPRARRPGPDLRRTRRVLAAGDRRLRPPGRRLRGDRRPVVDDRAAGVHRHQHGSAEGDAVRGSAAVPRPAAAGRPGARPGRTQTSVHTCAVLPGPGDHVGAERARPGDPGDGRLLAGRGPEAAPRTARCCRAPTAARCCPQVHGQLPPASVTDPGPRAPTTPATPPSRPPPATSSTPSSTSPTG